MKRNYVNELAEGTGSMRLCAQVEGDASRSKRGGVSVVGTCGQNRTDPGGVLPSVAEALCVRLGV